jgi:hypothetical protein
VPIYLIAQNPVSFFEEHIDFKLDSNFFSVNGIYSFYNNSSEIVTRQIRFPFAVKRQSIDSIKVLNLNSQKLLHYNFMEDAVSFNLTVLPTDTLDINIFYRQKSSGKNTYILTTTQAWGNSLNKAIYTLTTPIEMAINSFSYIPDSVKVVGNNCLYKWEKQNFSPKVNFDIIIEK